MAQRAKTKAGGSVCSAAMVSPEALTRAPTQLTIATAAAIAKVGRAQATS
jgi:hypothetical protein